MEIVIENPTTDVTTTPTQTPTTMMIASPGNPGFVGNPSHHRPYRTAYVSGDATSPSVEYYGTLQPGRPRSRIISPEPDYETSPSVVPTSVRRVDRSGLLEIAELEPHSLSSSRGRHLTGAENPGHSGTLTRRIDRSGLLEAVPEVPDQCQIWRTPEETGSRSLTTRQLDPLQQNQSQRLATSPRSSRSTNEINGQSNNRRSLTEPLVPTEKRQISTTSPTSQSVDTATLTSSSSSSSSPYRRRYPGGSPTLSLDKGSTTLATSACCQTDQRTRNSRNSLTSLSPSTNKFLPIESLPPRGRQSYVDLTGATYTRSSSATSPLTIISRRASASIDSSLTNLIDTENSRDLRQQPDCLGRLSPRSRNERLSPAPTMSAIPDVIEAHGSRTRVIKDDDNQEKDGPEGERAEAEGCEHTAIESLEEGRVSFKGQNKILHNDNIQTLRVIILSEQL